MDERHTGTIISTKFQTILEEWGIDRQKVHCMVRDHGSNMVRAMQLSGFEDISCAIHQIQLCIRAGVESQEWLLQLIAKLKKIATHFNHSLVAQAELTKIQKERLNQSPLSVIQDCPTRWNSTFYMMERFSKLKDSLVLYLSANPIAMISPEDWMNIQKFVQLMQPFEEITRNLSSSQISISSVIPLIQVLKTTLQQEETKPNTSEQFINFITKLRDELNSSVRFGNLVEDDKYTIATYLDPRYKSHFFTSVIAEQVESKLLNMTINTIRTRQSNSIQDDDCEPSPKRSRTQIAIEDIEVQPSTSKSSASLQILESMLSVNEDQEEDSSTADDGDNLLLKIQSHLREYKKEKRLPLHEDPLMWWNGNAHKYPHILPIVRQYLSAPPSSVASEQLFSGAGLIYEEHRNRLKVDADTFYVYNAYIYHGRGSDGKGLSDAEKRLGIPSQSVIRLSKDLEDRGLTYLGIMKKNKKEIPPEFQPHKDREEGTSLYGFTKDFTMVSYVTKAKKAVILVSSMHHTKETDVLTNKPIMITDYNKTKGGVDEVAKKCSNYSCSRRTRRWPMVLFYRLIDLSGLNSYVLYNKCTNKVNMRRGPVLLSLLRN
ncbi:Zinc finger BED domain-containing protein 1 [Eumeta japonica]|uniref:Zinc finger BED domain-containing protein 1 n=1 Tax=Eumeta variegata TaxID=151549 RepID=A0A4C1TDZ5_EUMVA|nr:Zinc finger BED domain-containing protein 1 [Eumeta japonica]